MSEGAGASDPKIDSLLAKNADWNSWEIKVLKEHLSARGYDVDTSDRDFGPAEARAAVQYIKDNPEIFASIARKPVEMVMQHAGRELRDVANNAEEYTARVQTYVNARGNIIVTKEESIKTMQALLKAGGHYDAKIDGIIGPKSRAGARLFGDPAETPPVPSTRQKEFTETAESITQPAATHNGFGIANGAIESAWRQVITGRPQTPQIIPASYNPRPLVVIDPGHGADIGSNDIIDGGAESPHIAGLTEVSVADPVALEVARNLHARGYQVAFTRNPGEQLAIEGSKGLTLQVRPQFALALGEQLNTNGVIFISLHANIAGSSASGDIAFIQSGDNVRACEASRELATTLMDNFNMNGSDRDLGCRNFSVLRNFERAAAGNGLNAAVLFEMGFLSNQEDSRALDAIRRDPRAAGQNIAGSIDSFVRERIGGEQQPMMATGPETDGPMQG